MKTIIISLLLIVNINAQNIWYVDRDATGANTGRSWTDAWTSLDSAGWDGKNTGVNWAIIQGGDSIYISGGTDSTLYTNCRYIYPYNKVNGYTWNEQVVIALAWQSGHNGSVYFGAASNNENWILQIHNVSNIKLIGFNFIDNRTANNGTMLYIGGAGANSGYDDSLQVIENCHIVGNGLGSMIYFEGSKITIKGCLIEQSENNNMNDQDPFGISGGKGGHTIDNCTIIMRNGNEETLAHRDGIQISNVGQSGGARHKITISNNLIIDTNPNGSTWNNMIYCYGAIGLSDISLLIYNNIIVNRKIHTSIAPIGTGRDYATIGGEPDYQDWLSLKLFNNTIITKGNGGGSVITAWSIDTLMIKNNLIIADTTIDRFFNFENREYYWAAVQREIDYNYFTEYGGQDLNEHFATTPESKTTSQWLAEGWDAHSSFGNSTDITFANKYGLNKADYFTTSGRDAGVDLSSDYPFLAYDILGNPRSGNWDIGALEYQGGGQSNNINLMTKLFLEGPFNSNSMNTDLSLPNTQPYNTAPWNYSGSESLSSGSSSGFVDWVLVELRNSSNPTQVVSRRAAILKNDGTLLDTDGSIGVSFSNIQAGSYYVAVFHRNHIAVMSANPIQLSANSQIYDFTTGFNKAYIAYEGNPMTELAPGKFGMYAGNGNGDYGISISDKNQVWTPQNGILGGYNTGDFNLDSNVNDADVYFYNLNNGKVSQLPNTQ